LNYLLVHACGNRTHFDDTLGIFFSIIFMSQIFVELILLPRIWVLFETAQMFLDYLILVNNSSGISYRTERFFFVAL
jgi:hypothetical protein